MKPPVHNEPRTRKPFVEPKVERHGKLPEVTGVSIPASGATEQETA